MFAVLEGRERRFYDVDDTLFDRDPLIRLGGLLADSVKRRPPPSVEQGKLPHVNRDLDPNSRLSDVISYYMHQLRPIAPGVISVVRRLADLGNEQFINTGRPNRERWVGMTLQKLEEAGILQYFSGFFFTPEGVSAYVSKAAAMTEVRSAHPGEPFLYTHFDDDPRTIWFMAHACPWAEFGLIHHSITGLMKTRRALAGLKNVYPISSIGGI